MGWGFKDFKRRLSSSIFGVMNPFPKSNCSKAIEENLHPADCIILIFGSKKLFEILIFDSSIIIIFTKFIQN
jgi:hypothetical protein